MAICRYLQNSEAPQHKMSQYLGVYISSFEPFAHTHTHSNSGYKLHPSARSLIASLERQRMRGRSR